MNDFVLRPLLAQLGLDIDEALDANGGAELRFNCPFCEERGEPRPDTKHKLYVHVEEDDKFGAYNCFRCGKRGHLVQRIDPNYRPRCAGAVEAEETDTSRFHVKRGRETPLPVKVELPGDYSPVLPMMEAHRYLIGRGLTADDITYYQLGIARRRIVFPDYLDGELVFWVSRSYVDDKGPKYFNAPGVPRTGLLYNLGRWKSEPREQIVVVEGPISAIVAGRDAVATYGKAVTDEQVQLLRSLGCARYYVSLDPDAREQSLELAKALYGAGEIYLVPIPEREDPASLGRAVFRQLLDHALPFDLYNKATQIQFMLSHAPIAQVA